jgi:ABC-2 type transport system permease protein
MLPLLAKNLRDTAGLLLACCAVMFAFHWLQVWFVSELSFEAFKGIIDNIPEKFRRLFPVPPEQLMGLPGRISMSYSEPLTLIIMSAWSIGRGSDAVSGEIDRGTMEMLLAQPLRRIELLVAHALATINGVAMISLSAWLGTVTGINVVELESPVRVEPYLYCALNLFAFGFFLAGGTTLLSSMDRYRWRTIGIAAGIVVVEKIVEIIGQSVPRLRWLEWYSFFTAYRPPRFITQPEIADQLAWETNGLLIGLGMAGYLAAAILFCRRDLPAPL